MSGTTGGPRIDFYVLDDDRPGGRERFACRLADKAYRMGHWVHLLAEPDAVHGLDDLLWTFAPSSFVPHAVVSADGPDAAAVPVRIGDRPPADPPAAGGLLVINLRDRPVAGFERYPRIAEIVAAAQRDAGRERFRYYREHGIEPETHRIR